jgi:hypothetical protein
LATLPQVNNVLSDEGSLYGGRWFYPNSNPGIGFIMGKENPNTYI